MGTITLVAHHKGHYTHETNLQDHIQHMHEVSTGTRCWLPSRQKYAHPVELHAHETNLQDHQAETISTIGPHFLWDN